MSIVLTDLKMQRIRGLIADYYLCKHEIEFCESRIKYYEDTLGVKGISYEKEPMSVVKTREQKLIDMIEKIDELEERIEKCQCRLDAYKSFGLSKDELELLDKIYINRRTYTELGKELGFGSTHTYRIVKDIFTKAYEYIESIGL